MKRSWAMAACLSAFLLAACDDHASAAEPQASRWQTDGGAEAGEEQTADAGGSAGVQRADFAALIDTARAQLEGVDRDDKEALKAASEAALAKRRAAQCALFEDQPLAVEGWEGTVYGVYPLQGVLALQVEFAEKAYLMTSFGPGMDSELGTETAFAPGAPLYDTVEGLGRGDRVVVSGRFHPTEGAEGCIFQIASSQPHEWIEYPNFFFEYTAIEKQ